MRILVTGNMGYVGPVLVAHLARRFPQAALVGFDTGYFADCLAEVDALPERHLEAQHVGDVRSFPERLLEGCDALVHLAAVSNDPMGRSFEALTDEINHRAGAALAHAAARAGVRRFVFASSCSIYGFAQGAPRRESDPLDPLTAYARSKVALERALGALAAPGMTITALRFATACGWSPRLRLDLVLNDFVASALATGEVRVLSDGTPWRPLIDVQDMARAVEWALLRDESPGCGGPYLAVNVGADDWNWRVKDLAEAVAAALPGTKVGINPQALPDRRSYQVDFSLFRRLAPEHQPRMSLAGSIAALYAGLRAAGFSDPAFRDSHLMRLKALERHLDEGRLDAELRWRG